MSSSRSARIVAVVTMSATKSCLAASHPASSFVPRSGYISRQRSMTATSRPSIAARSAMSASAMRPLMMRLPDVTVLATHTTVRTAHARSSAAPKARRGALRALAVAVVAAVTAGISSSG